MASATGHSGPQFRRGTCYPVLSGELQIPLRLCGSYPLCKHMKTRPGDNSTVRYNRSSYAPPTRMYERKYQNASQQKLCKYYNTPKGCRFGGSCRFRHSRDIPVCRYFSTAGGCKEAENCSFKHVDADTEKAQTAAAWQKAMSLLMPKRPAEVKVDKSPGLRKCLNCYWSSEEGNGDEASAAHVTHILRRIMLCDADHLKLFSGEPRLSKGACRCTDCQSICDSPHKLVVHLAEQAQIPIKRGPKHKFTLLVIVSVMAVHAAGDVTESDIIDVLEELLRSKSPKDDHDIQLITLLMENPFLDSGFPAGYFVYSKPSSDSDDFDDDGLTAIDHVDDDYAGSNGDD